MEDIPSEKINYFGQVKYRGRTDSFGIKTDDRRRHMYIIGKTGMGKTNMIQNMAIQDIREGHGLGVLDPHGEFAEELLHFVPKERIDDVVYFNPADTESPVGLNLMEDVGYDKRHLVASGLMGVFKKIWVDVWSARMEYILNNTILALLEYPTATLLDVNRMLANKNFRKDVLTHVKDPIVRAFWIEEFARYTDRLASEATASIQNKIGQFTTAPLIRNIVGQKDSTINLREIMDEGKILILNLSKGRIGEDNSRLLGAMAITKLYLAAMSRIDVPESKRRDFFLYVDEFQSFASEAFGGILSEARKYRLCLTLAHQYIAQMDETVRDAVFGNIGTFVAFRVGAEDAEAIEKEFAPEFAVEDFVNLPKYTIALKLMIDGATSRGFSAHTTAPMEVPSESYREDIIQKSREKYGTPRERIEEVIAQWDPSRNEGGGAPNPPSPDADRNRRPYHTAKSTPTPSLSLKDAQALYPPPTHKRREEGKQSYPRGGAHHKTHGSYKPQSALNAEEDRKSVDLEGLRTLLKNIETETTQDKRDT